MDIGRRSAPVLRDCSGEHLNIRLQPCDSSFGRSALGSAGDAANILVTSYAGRRPDGTWTWVLVNRDQANAHAVRIVFDRSDRKGEGFFKSQVTMVTFGSEQYVWLEAGVNSHADPDGPPVMR